MVEVVQKGEEIIHVDNPAKLPDASVVDEMREPIMEAHILVSQEYVGNVIKLCIKKRGIQNNIQYVGNQVSLTYEFPVEKVVLDFFGRLKSTSRDFASLDYAFIRYQAANMVRLDVLINGDRVDELAIIVHRDQAQYRGRELAERLRELIPRQMFDVAIQAAIGAYIIARTTVKALRKNVTAKFYGCCRKRKLLEKQKTGKKRMKQIGRVEMPQEAFLSVLNVDNK